MARGNKKKKKTTRIDDETKKAEIRASFSQLLYSEIRELTHDASVQMMSVDLSEIKKEDCDVGEGLEKQRERVMERRTQRLRQLEVSGVRSAPPPPAPVAKTLKPPKLPPPKANEVPLVNAREENEVVMHEMDRHIRERTPAMDDGEDRSRSRERIINTRSRSRSRSATDDSQFRSASTRQPPVTAPSIPPDRRAFSSHPSRRRSSSRTGDVAPSRHPVVATNITGDTSKIVSDSGVTGKKKPTNVFDSMFGGSDEEEEEEEMEVEEVESTPRRAPLPISTTPSTMFIRELTDRRSGTRKAPAPRETDTQAVQLAMKEHDDALFGDSRDFISVMYMNDDDPDKQPLMQEIEQSMNNLSLTLSRNTPTHFADHISYQSERRSERLAELKYQYKKKLQVDGAVIFKPHWFTKPGLHPILEAAERGDAARVAEIVRGCTDELCRHPDPRRRDTGACYNASLALGSGKGSMTPMAVAAYLNLDQFVLSLYEEAGRDEHLRDLIIYWNKARLTCNTLPIMYAFTAGHAEVARALLSAPWVVQAIEEEQLRRKEGDHVALVAPHHGGFIYGNQVQESALSFALHHDSELLLDLAILHKSLLIPNDSHLIQAFRDAAQSGNLPFMKRIWDLSDPSLSPLLLSSSMTTGSATTTSASRKSNASDFSALMIAIDNGHLEMVDFISEKSTRECLDDVDPFGRTCIEVAALGGHDAIVDLLKKKYNMELTASSHLLIAALNNGKRSERLALSLLDELLPRHDWHELLGDCLWRAVAVRSWKAVEKLLGKYVEKRKIQPGISSLLQRDMNQAMTCALRLPPHVSLAEKCASIRQLYHAGARLENHIWMSPTWKNINDGLFPAVMIEDFEFEQIKPSACRVVSMRDATRMNVEYVDQMIQGTVLNFKAHLQS